MNWKILFFLSILERGTSGSTKEEEAKDKEAKENEEIHRFAMEHGIWSPDPSVLVGLHDNSDRLEEKGQEELPVPKSNAKFLTPNNTFVTVQVGNTAIMRCEIDNVSSSETISWVRRRDHHLITLGTNTYTSDGRFHLTHTPEDKKWTLNLKYAQIRDSGVYECQISAHPPTGIITSLKVIQPVAIIKGSPNLYAQAGSGVTLICRLKNFTIPPPYVFWYHEGQMINYDSQREVSVVSQGGESVLRLAKMQQKDSGNYTCAPANAKAATITLHVIPGELPAAMQRASGSSRQNLIALHGILICLSLSL